MYRGELRTVRLLVVLRAFRPILFIVTTLIQQFRSIAALSCFEAVPLNMFNKDIHLESH